ncbi:hypothetical protein [uncultured Microscilla sp.]|nr:hypothetical protein [uncultured Microscilla sp.]
MIRLYSSLKTLINLKVFGAASIASSYLTSDKPKSSESRGGAIANQ